MVKRGMGEVFFGERTHETHKNTINLSYNRKTLDLSATPYIIVSISLAFRGSIEI